MVRGKAQLWAGAVLALALLAELAVYQRQVTHEPMPQAIDATDPVALALASGKPTVVEFGANACVTCREMRPVLTELAKSHGDRITVADVDILKQRDYISRYQIRLMPTQVFFDAQGRETGRNMGKISAEDILARLSVPHSP